MMTCYLLAGPASEPISLAEAKAFLRVPDDAEDGLIATLIAAARIHIESVAGLALITQSWRLVLDEWPANRLVQVPMRPLQSVTAITAYGEDGEGSALALPQFAWDAQGVRIPNPIAGMPVLQPHFGIEIDVVTGFGPTPEDVPAPLRQALLLLVGHWYEHRDAVIQAGAGSIIPAALAPLIAPYRAVRL